MPIDFQTVLNSEKARNSLEEMWYNDLFQEEANHVLTLTGSGGGMCSGELLVVEWCEMYFIMPDEGYEGDGPFKSVEEALSLLERLSPGWLSPSLQPELYSDVVPLECLLRFARGLVESEGSVVHINDQWFILSGGEWVERGAKRVANENDTAEMNP